jgi:hypothetical protein
MSTTRHKIFGAFEGIKGATWSFNILSLTVGGVDVTVQQLAGATITGIIGGVALTSSVADPSPGVRLSVSVAPSSTVLAVPSDTAYLSDIRIQFSPTEVQKLRVLFTVLDSPTP